MSFGDDGGPRSAAIRSAIDYGVDRGVVFVAAAADTPVDGAGSARQPAAAHRYRRGPRCGQGPDRDLGDFSGERSSFAGQRQPDLARRVRKLRSGQPSGPDGPPGLFGAFPANSTHDRDRRQGARSAAPPSPATTATPTSRGPRWPPRRSTAIAALIKNLNPDIPLTELLRILKETASNSSWEPELGWGIIDAGAASRRRAHARSHGAGLRGRPLRVVPARRASRFAGAGTIRRARAPRALRDPLLRGLRPALRRRLQAHRAHQAHVGALQGPGGASSTASTASPPTARATASEPPSGSDARTRVAKAR